MCGVTIKTNRGITTVNDTIFTGTLVAFHNNSSDTIEVQNYEDGMKSGVQTRWWSHGMKKSEYHFKNNEFDGVCRDWSANGTLIRQMNYADGHEKGLQQLWDDDGTLRANYVARNGRNYGLAGVKSCVTRIH